MSVGRRLGLPLLAAAFGVFVALLLLPILRRRSVGVIQNDGLRLSRDTLPGTTSDATVRRFDALVRRLQLPLPNSFRPSTKPTRSLALDEDVYRETGECDEAVSVVADRFLKADPELVRLACKDGVTLEGPAARDHRVYLRVFVAKPFGRTFLDLTIHVPQALTG